MNDLTAWIGRTETLHDTLHPTPVAALHATFDHPGTAVEIGMPLPPLGTRHAERHLDRVRHLLGVVGIDDEGSLHPLGGAGEARQDEHARIERVLRGHVFLGHEIHAVAQRRHHGNTRVAVHLRQLAPRRRAVDVMDRHPVERAVGAIDRARKTLQLAADVAVGFHAVPRRSGDLGQHDRADLLWVFF